MLPGTRTPSQHEKQRCQGGLSTIEELKEENSEKGNKISRGHYLFCKIYSPVLACIKANNLVNK